MDHVFSTSMYFFMCIISICSFQELVMLGFSSLYSSERSGYSVVRLINNLYELLQLQIKNNQVKDDLEAR